VQLPIGAQWEGASKNSSLFPSSPGTLWGHPPSPPWLLSPDLPPELVEKWSGHEVTPNFAENELLFKRSQKLIQYVLQKISPIERGTEHILNGQLVLKLHQSVSFNHYTVLLVGG
jgi:hypothetical protein